VSESSYVLKSSKGFVLFLRSGSCAGMLNQGPWMDPANRALTIWRIEAKTMLFDSIAKLVTWMSDVSLRLCLRHSQQT
jgi:hypothetical protein